MQRISSKFKMRLRYAAALRHFPSMVGQKRLRNELAQTFKKLTGTLGCEVPRA